MRLLLLALLAFACRAAPEASGPPVSAPTEPVEADEIGSLRNAQVALARTDGSGRLSYFAREIDDAEQREIAALAPGVDLVVGLSREEALERAEEAHGADVYYATPEFLRAARQLVWVQAHSAGVDRYIEIPELVDNQRIVFTNLRGVHGPAIADHAFAMLLALTRDMPILLAARAEGRWLREGSGVLEPIALEGRTLLVVGLGGIGTEIARRGHGFGMRVIATRRSDTPAPSYVEYCGRADELLALLPQADVVAIAVPLTVETEHLFDARAFAAMKPGSYLINIARGKVVDTGELVEALSSKKLAGACLDVTDPEPLPQEHPLWKLANVVITPHMAATAALTDERARVLFLENLRRFDAGEPLYNVVDKQAGY